jgi:hypothetical protein
LHLLDAQHRVAGELRRGVHVLVQLFAGLADQVADGGVDALQHLHHADLVAGGTCHGLRHGQRAHAGGGHAGAAVDHLAAGLLQHVQRQVAVDAHRLLGLDVGEVLARVEQHLLPQRLGLLRVGRLQLDLTLAASRWSSWVAKRDAAASLVIASHSLARVASMSTTSLLHVVARGVELAHRWS